MRGKDLATLLLDVCTRITPAYAGKSKIHGRRRCKRRDHPRLCGEKEYTVERRIDGEGSPPPMRGKARMADATILTKGITPAYAGKRLKRS